MTSPGTARRVPSPTGAFFGVTTPAGSSAARAAAVEYGIRPLTAITAAVEGRAEEGDRPGGP